jgi:hypothetical protein
MTHIDGITDKQNRATGDQSTTLVEHSTQLELSLDELSYVSGGFWPIRPIKPWYCGEY